MQNISAFYIIREGMLTTASFFLEKHKKMYIHENIVKL
jgi:hypothetical protein